MRRSSLAVFAALAAVPALPQFARAQAARSGLAITYPPVTVGRTLVFPRDHGAHPEFRTEWWYLTGWLGNGENATGFQITFFRSRTLHSEQNPSRFAPTQLLFAHAALADRAKRTLMHDQRAARAAPNYAQASESQTRLQIGDWSMSQLDANRYSAQIKAKSFTLNLTLQANEPPWLQGSDGFSRKGPKQEQASYYYSRPQLRVEGSAGAGPAQKGVAWLDHEWSSELLDPKARGWDWIGLNFTNGEALMAFQINTDSTPLWRHSNLRRADGVSVNLSDSLRWRTVRSWRSPRTLIEYPVERELEFGDRRLRLVPLIDDQELDSRASTGAIYWEGAVRVIETTAAGPTPVGLGYLELTGYGERLRL